MKGKIRKILVIERKIDTVKYSNLELEYQKLFLTIDVNYQIQLHET